MTEIIQMEGIESKNPTPKPLNKILGGSKLLLLMFLIHSLKRSLKMSRLLETLDASFPP